MKKTTFFQQHPAPRNLSPAGRIWWGRLLKEYVFESPDQFLILEAALSSFDRWQQARKVIDAEGPVCADKYGVRRVHPAVLVERDSKFAMLRGLKQLGLDVLPPGLVGRPEGT
jgi:hypothetical protein